MSLLRITEPDEATGELAEAYQGALDKIGFAPNGYKMFGVSIDVLNRQSSLMGLVMQHPTLSPRFSAILRLLVSKNRQCDYCVGANSSMLQNYFDVSAEQIEAFKQDIETVPLKSREKALLIFVLKATEDTQSTTAADIEALRNQGWADHEILDAMYQGAQQVAADMLFNTFQVKND
ncbi:MAG TPA: hypothetical protein DD827_01980 [Gammaproteobacteria bacterium]|jgi:uncharacterized peroxidase-related enzyme|nr:hypothetical protein [Gammaproteobacteria bacterium]